MHSYNVSSCVFCFFRFFCFSHVALSVSFVVKHFPVCILLFNGRTSFSSPCNCFLPLRGRVKPCLKLFKKKKLGRRDIRVHIGGRLGGRSRDRLYTHSNRDPILPLWWCATQSLERPQGIEKKAQVHVR